MAGASGTGYDELNRTVYVLLERVPGGLEIEYVKSDVQGLDLEVLRSAGEQLRRATFVRAEVIVAALYESVGERHSASEQELVDYASEMGFRFVLRHPDRSAVRLRRGRPASLTSARRSRA